MSTATIGISENLNNHELDKLVEKTTELLKLSAVQAMNARMNPGVYRFKPNPISVGGSRALPYESVGTVITERFSNLDPAIVRSARLDLGRDTEITTSIRRWAVDIRSEQSILNQIDVPRHFNFVNETTFNDTAMKAMVTEFGTTSVAPSTVPVRTAIESELSAVNVRYESMLPANWIGTVLGGLRVGGGTPAPANTGVRCRVHEVKCIDETNPEWFGHDEIAWGGSAVDDKDNTTKIPEYYVGGGFDDGDRKVYSPPKILKSFSLSDNVYPKTFLVVLVLAEKDCGGLSTFINNLYQAVKAHLQIILSSLGALAGATIGEAIGGSIGTAIAGPLGTVIGLVAGAILGALIGWLIDIFKDDIFPARATSLTLGSGDAAFQNGALVSAPLYLKYHDHGGRYRVKLDWEILR